MSIRQDLQNYISDSGLSQVAVARAVGVTSPVVNQYLHGKYPGNVQEIERKIAAYLQKQREREAERKLEVDYVLTTASVWMEAIASLPIQWDEQQDAGRITRAFACLLAEIERWPAPKMLIKHLPPRKELPQLEHKKQLTAEEQARGRENLKKLYQIIAEIFERKSNGSKKENPH